ncbi:MAG: uracil-DNA glycosylase [Microbacteriaceae bacterium]
MRDDLGAPLGPGWDEALAPVAAQRAMLSDFLAAEVAAGRGYLPAAHAVMRAFDQPFDEVRVLVVGQDPYPTPGHAIGLSFATGRDVRPLPRSLHNIYRELNDDLGIAPAAHGDLSAWARNGVLLLNRVLTVQPGLPGSHRGAGWEAVTEQAIRALASRTSPLVAILWGRDAAKLRPLLGTIPVVESAHPSPLSASRGFFGSRPFSRANALLAQQGSPPVDWRIRDSSVLAPVN